MLRQPNSKAFHRLAFSFRRSILLPQPLPTFRTPSLRMKPSLWNCAMGSVASLAQAGIADPHCGSATPACAQHHDHCTTQPKLLTAHFLTSGFDETPPPMERRHFFGHPGFLSPRIFSLTTFFLFGKFFSRPTFFDELFFHNRHSVRDPRLVINLRTLSSLCDRRRGFPGAPCSRVRRWVCQECWAGAIPPPERHPHGHFCAN